MSSELNKDDLRVLRRLAKGPTTSVDRSTAWKLKDRGLVGQVVGVSWKFCITDAGLDALILAQAAEIPTPKFLSEFPDSFVA